MQINRFGTGVFIFCVTFLLGFLTVESLVLNEDNSVSNEIEQKTVLNQINRTPVEQSTVETPCKKYFNQSKYNDLLKEELKLTKLLVDEIQASQSQKITRRKLKKLAREIEFLKQFRKKMRISESGRNGYHTLLYIENCAEYK